MQGWGTQLEGGLPQEGLQMANSWPGVAVTHPSPARWGCCRQAATSPKAERNFDKGNRSPGVFLECTRLRVWGAESGQNCPIMLLIYLLLLLWFLFFFFFGLDKKFTWCRIQKVQRGHSEKSSSPSCHPARRPVFSSGFCILVFSSLSHTGTHVSHTFLYSFTWP